MANKLDQRKEFKGFTMSCRVATSGASTILSTLKFIFSSLIIISGSQLLSAEEATSRDLVRIVCERILRPDAADREIIIIEQTSAELHSGSELITISNATSSDHFPIIMNIPAQIRIYRGGSARFLMNDTPAQVADRLAALEPMEISDDQDYLRSSFVRVDGHFDIIGRIFSFKHKHSITHKRLRYDTDIESKGSYNYIPSGKGRSYSCLETEAF